MGGLNGRIDSKVANNIVGKHGDDVIKDNRIRRVEGCDQNRLKIINGIFQHKYIHKYTWTHPTKNQKSVIDYIIVRQNSKTRFHNIRVHRSAVCLSDHFLVKGQTSIKFNILYKSTELRTQTLGYPQYKLECFKDDYTAFLYKLCLAEKMSSFPEECIETQYAFLQGCIHEAAIEALRQRETIARRENEPWWTKELEKLVKAKKSV